MTSVNHLKNKDSQQAYLPVAFGLQAASGSPSHSKVAGAAPTHQITAFNPLGVGEWNRCLGAYYQGEEIAAANYHFHSGALATGMTSGPQQVDSFFPKDVPHSGTAAIGYEIPQGLGNADIAANPPNKFKGIFETKKSWNFNAAGVLSDFSYSPNPARCILEAIRSFGRLPNLPPSVWTNHIQYWLSRIDFGSLAAFRDFHAQTETVDYRTLPNFDGFGLTAKYYSGTNFQTFVSKFVHANFVIDYGSQPPAATVSAGNFSGSFDGYIKFPTSETWTITVTVDNGTRLWLNNILKIDQWTDDGLHPIGVYTTTFNASANIFVPILAHWNDGGGIGNFTLEWESATQAKQVIPSKYLYPKEEQQALYESHIFIAQPSSLAAAIREILFVSNSIMQDVNGKLRFVCLEQLTPSFALDDSKISDFKFRRRDILNRDPFTEYEAQFNDLDSQYLEEPASPVSVKVDTYARKTFERVKVVNLYNATRWRALKLLKAKVALELGNDLLADATTEMARTYPITAGDLITVTHRKTGSSPRNYLVKQTVDSGVEESNEISSSIIEQRKLVLQEWGNEVADGSDKE